MRLWRYAVISTAAVLAALAAAAPAAEPAPTPAAPAPAAAPAGSASAGSASAESAGGESALIQLSDRLADEAERQHEVNQRMDVAIDRFQAIILDLESNDLIKQAGGPQLERLTGVLKLLSQRHVPDAAKYLEEARRQLAMLKPNLVAADREIEIIVNELDRLLAAATGQDDDLLRELEVIIQDEKRALRDTKEWGVQLLQNPDAAEKPRRTISAAQDAIVKRTDRFMDRLRQTRDAEQDPARKQGMQKAHDVLDQNKVPKVLDGAKGDIDEKKPVAATKGQADAIKWLEEAAKYLRSEDTASEIQAMKEFRDRLEKILKEQTLLRETTEKVPAEKFPQEKNDLQVRQRGLDKEVVTATADVPPAASPEVKTHLQNADQHMQKAENQISQTQQQPAAGSQKEAEKSLQEAIKTLDQDIAKAEQAWDAQNQPLESLADIAQKAMELAEKQRELRIQTGQTPQAQLPQVAPPQDKLTQEAQALNEQLPMPQFQQAVQEMQQASQSLQQSQQQPAMQHQEAAEKALMDAAKALEQAQAAMDLAAQQMQLMNQTARTPQGQLPKLAPPQQSLQQQTQAAQFQEAADLMQEAAQALEEGQGEEAQDGQQAAIDSLVGSAAHAMGMEPGKMPGMTPGMTPGIGMVPGLMPGLRAMPRVPAIDPKQMGIRDFGRGGVGGAKAAKGEDTWQPLGDRERDSLFQKYARQLPPEYRELLGDYYEALSKEAPRTRTRGPAAAAPAPATEVKP